MIALLLAAAAAQTPVDAERAFAADAQNLGQWTAFRDWSTADAVMFTPQPTNAHAFLKDRKDPPVAVFWWPGRSYLSCDGTHAVNTGPWVREWGKSVGYFTTVWQRQPDGGWKWTYDAGDALATPRAEGGDIQPRRASCESKPVEPIMLGAEGWHSGRGGSADETLAWTWSVGPAGERRLIVQLWNGRDSVTVLDDQVAAPPQ